VRPLRRCSRGTRCRSRTRRTPGTVARSRAARPARPRPPPPAGCGRGRRRTRRVVRRARDRRRGHLAGQLQLGPGEHRGPGGGRRERRALVGAAGLGTVHPPAAAPLEVRRRVAAGRAAQQRVQHLVAHEAAGQPMGVGEDDALGVGFVVPALPTPRPGGGRCRRVPRTSAPGPPRSGAPRRPRSRPTTGRTPAAARTRGRSPGAARSGRRTPRLGPPGGARVAARCGWC
jgi:hypothetical protein